MTNVDSDTDELADYKKRLKAFSDEMWPNKSDEATFDRVLKYTIAHGNAYLNTMDISLTDPESTDDQKRLWFAQCHAMQTAHDVVLLLLKLRELAPEVAEEMAHLMWAAADSGDSYGEWFWAWSIENDVPVPPSTLAGKTQEQAKADHLRFVELMAKREEHGNAVQSVLAQIPALQEGMSGPDLFRHACELVSELSDDEVKNGLQHLINEQVLESFEQDGKRLVRWTQVPERQ